MIIQENPDERFPLSNLVGRNIECEDGVVRRIVNITNPVRQDRAHLVIINEGDPAEPSGHWVHALTAARLLHGQRPPDREEKEAFTRLVEKAQAANADTFGKAITRPKFKVELD